jgi:hypothetical protein
VPEGGIGLAVRLEASERGNVGLAGAADDDPPARVECHPAEREGTTAAAKGADHPAAVAERSIEFAIAIQAGEREPAHVRTAGPPADNDASTVHRLDRLRVAVGLPEVDARCPTLSERLVELAVRRQAADGEVAEPRAGRPGHEHGALRADGHRGGASRDPGVTGVGSRVEPDDAALAKRSIGMTVRQTAGDCVDARGDDSALSTDVDRVRAVIRPVHSEQAAAAECSIEITRPSRVGQHGGDENERDHEHGQDGTHEKPPNAARPRHCSRHRIAPSQVVGP